MSRTVVFMADGLEECEGLIVVDLLRRAGGEVVTASINGTKSVISSHSIRFDTDALAEELDYSQFDLAVLPGGVKGTENLGSSTFVREKCIEFAESKKLAAICAAPTVLASLGILEGKNATVHPSCEDGMAGAKLTRTPVAIDGNITTGNGLAAAIEFGLELVRQLEGEETAKKVSKGISLGV